MAWISVVLLICAFYGVVCVDNTCKDKIKSDEVAIKVYKIYLMGFTILFMTIAIICLSIALYMAKKDKQVLGLRINKTPSYVRQESGHGVTLCNVTSSNEISSHNKYDGSTLTVNSGIVEISITPSEPSTPTRVDDGTIIYKKPLVPIIPPMQKVQMDNLLREVLSKKQRKSESTMMKELEALTKLEKSPSLERQISITDETTGESLYHNSLQVFMQHEAKAAKEQNAVTKDKLKDLEKKAPSNLSLTVKNEEDNVDGEETFEVKHEQLDDEEEEEQEVYDTLPNPVRCVNVDDEDDLTDIPVYDMPPKKTWDDKVDDGSNVVMDNDTLYLLPLNKLKLDEEQEKSCYINAKLCDSI